MKIITCCQAVPEGISKVELSEPDDKIECESFSLVMNESDECALEEALFLKKEFGAEITVLTAGSLRAQSVLYMALAKGADKAIRIDAESTNPAIISQVMAKAIEKMDYDLILIGVESSDNMSGQTGVSLAERLNRPHAFAVTQIEIEQGKSIAKVTRELGQGIRQLLEIPFPAVLCVQSTMRPISNAAVAKLLRARRQPIGSITLDSLGINWDEETANGLKLLEVFTPPRAAYSEIIEGSPREIAEGLKRRIDHILQ